MSTFSDFDGKVRGIRSSFAGLVGQTIVRYETAEIQQGMEWDTWADLPIRLYLDGGRLVAVSWSKFDDLWLASDETLPFSVDGSTVRWVENSLASINKAIGASLTSVMLGRGQMTLDGRDVEIWTRLLLVLDTGWLELFNALDENGYAFHSHRPAGEFVNCT